MHPHPQRSEKVHPQAVPLTRLVLGGYRCSSARRDASVFRVRQTWSAGCAGIGLPQFLLLAGKVGRMECATFARAFAFWS